MTTTGVDAIAKAALDGQRWLLTAALYGYGEDVWSWTSPEAFDEGNLRNSAYVLHSLYRRGSAITLDSVMSEALATSRRVEPMQWLMGEVTGAEAIARAQHGFGAAKILETVIRARQLLETGVDPWRVVEDMDDILHGLDRPATADQTVPWWTWREVYDFTVDESEEVLPGLLHAGERLILTGAEGRGKTTLSYQLVMGAAYGVSPIEYTETFEPRRVMVLDVENWHETQVRSLLHMMSAAYRRHSPLGDADPDMVLLRPRTIDLLRPEAKRMLVEAAERFQPNLLYMGSGYKLVDANDDWRVIATTIQRTADQIRALTGCAVIIETHAGHGFKEDRNGWRPDGSSYWLRWPEFGYGLKPVGENKGGLMPVEMVGWRGERVRDRAWPAGWMPGGVLPWTAIGRDEWDARPDLGGGR